MSISNLFSPNNYHIHVGDLSITQLPTVDNANANFLVRNGTTGILEVNNNVFPGNVTDGVNLGTGAPVFHAKNGTMLEFNSLSANGAQGFVINPAPPGPGGDIVINNPFLDQAVTTTSSPSFLSSVTVTGTSVATLTVTAGSAPAGTYLEYADLNGTSILGFPVLTGNRIATLPDASGTIALTSDLPAQNPFTLTGTVVLGAVSTPRTYEYSISARTTANASFQLNQFSPPNNTDAQTIICTLNGSFYNNVTLETAFIRQIRVFQYIPSGPTMTLTFTSEEVISAPVATNYYCQSAPDAGGALINIFGQPNNADATDMLINIQFLVRT